MVMPAMHSMLELPRPEMPHLPYGLSGQKLKSIAKTALASDEPGLAVSTVGGAMGPVWPAAGDHSLDFLEHFGGLKHLRVHLPSLTTIEPIKYVASSLETLELVGFDKPSRVSLSPIQNCRNLRSITLVRLPQDFDVIWQLPRLERLSLSGYRSTELRPPKPLSKLRNLYLGFGGMENLELLDMTPNITSVEILRTKGLGDLLPLASLTKLQFIALGDLAQVKRFPDCSRLKKLRRIYLDTMNGLEDLSGLAQAPALEDFILVNSKAPASLLAPLVDHPKLKRVALGLASRKANQEANDAFGDLAQEIFGTEHELFRLR